MCLSSCSYACSASTCFRWFLSLVHVSQRLIRLFHTDISRHLKGVFLTGNAGVGLFKKAFLSLKCKQATDSSFSFSFDPHIGGFT